MTDTESVSHHITPLVMYAFGGGHTHAHTHIRFLGKQSLQTRCMLAFSQYTPDSTNHIRHTHYTMICTIYYSNCLLTAGIARDGAIVNYINGSVLQSMERAQ